MDFYPFSDATDQEYRWWLFDCMHGMFHFSSAVPQRTFNLCLHPFMHLLLGASFEINSKKS